MAKCTTKRSKARKRFHFSASRNRRKNNRRTRNKLECVNAVLKDEWNQKEGIQENLRKMGFAMDPNKILPIPLTKDLHTNPSLCSTTNWSVEETELNGVNSIVPSEGNILEKQTALSRLKNPIRRRVHVPRIPPCEFEFVMYMVDKYNDDYEAMAMDKKNIYQETPSVIRKRIQKVLSLPDLQVKYLKKRGIIPEGEKTPKRVPEKVMKRWQRWEATKRYLIKEQKAFEEKIDLKDRQRREKRMLEKKMAKNAQVAI
ncbi:nucleolar protein 16-like [Artemia franciscana]